MSGSVQPVDAENRTLHGMYVCICFAVRESELAEVIADGARTEEEVGDACAAGTGYMDGHWAGSAAGHVEAGEDAVSAAVREAAEELGVVLDPGDLLPLCAMHRTAGRTEAGDQRVGFFFACRRWAGEP